MTVRTVAAAFNYTEDSLLNGRVRIRQQKEGYRVAIDPVLLAAAVPAETTHRVLDVGCGTGAAMFCLAARVPGVDVTGLELQPELAALAEDGVKLNNLSSRVRVVTGDLLSLPDLVCAYPFDIVMTNPPFGENGTVSPDPSIAAAHHETHVTLKQWIEACVKLLKPNGRFVIIHRADRLSAILAALPSRFGDTQIIPVFPKAEKPARRVILDTGQNRRTGETLRMGLILHNPDGAFTTEADAILRGIAAL